LIGLRALNEPEAFLFEREVAMVEKVDVLRDGTLVRHKLKGYEGKIEGTTAIKACFTRGGALLETSKETFQYRVVVNGQSMRYIAPVDDLEIVDAVVEIHCVNCQKNFYSKPGLTAKVCGRCTCGGWICPVCLSCQGEDAAKNKATACAGQRKRLAKKLANEK
jgi:hypothetical protein